jgi:catechol 2,3-dioxygenase-like lactoylglutathione lyase family enzyme
MNNIKIRSLDHVVFNVADPERSLRFYTEALGFVPERVEEFRAGKVPFPSVRINATTIIDFFRKPSPSHTPEAGNVNHIALTFANAPDEIKMFLEERGIEIVREMADNFGAQGDTAHSFHVKDPDGNVLELQAYA